MDEDHPMTESKHPGRELFTPIGRNRLLNLQPPHRPVKWSIEWPKWPKGTPKSMRDEDPQWDAEYNSHQASSIQHQVEEKTRSQNDHPSETTDSPTKQPADRPAKRHEYYFAVSCRSLAFLAIPTAKIKEEKACITILKIVESIKFLITGTWIGTHMHTHVN